MEMRAYPEHYLNKVQENIGTAFDYAVTAGKKDGAEFAGIFMISTAAKKIENGEINYLVGKSGIEIANEIICESEGRFDSPAPYESSFGASEEYWCGWILAYAQWYFDRRFRELFHAISFEQLKELYMPLHEADVMKTMDLYVARLKLAFPETNLKRYRKRVGITQTELAEKSGVGLRSIQMYEQQKKDINHASVETVYRLAGILGCRVEDLIEK